MAKCQAARADAAVVDRAKTLGYRGGRRELIGERRPRLRPASGAMDVAGAGRSPASSAASARPPRLPASAPRSCATSSPEAIATSPALERLAAGGDRPIERRCSSAANCWRFATRSLAAATQLLARRERRRSSRCPCASWADSARGAAADHRQSRIEQHAEPSPAHPMPPPSAIARSGGRRAIIASPASSDGDRLLLALQAARAGASTAAEARPNWASAAVIRASAASIAWAAAICCA